MLLKKRWTLAIGVICGTIMASLGAGYYYYRALSPATYPVHISIIIDYGNSMEEEYHSIYCGNTPLAALDAVADVETGEEWGSLYVHSVNAVTGYKGGEGGVLGILCKRRNEVGSNRQSDTE
ncbi:MAG: hypothetical protein AOA66_0924 [Candidatus Bathyarchaeota archaeon BA2]|nr:MAG: hypothetical protein AOA66_0924 [Candidatus Bathyarchaeota archaeon BA2]